MSILVPYSNMETIAVSCETARHEAQSCKPGWQRRQLGGLQAGRHQVEATWQAVGNVDPCTL